MPADYDTLKQGIYDLVYRMSEYEQRRQPVFPPKTVVDAIHYLERDGTLTGTEAEQLRQLDKNGDKRLKSVFGAYKALNDFDDLADSLCHLCGRKRVAKKP